MAIVIKAIMNITMKMKIMMRWYYLGNTSALGKINQCVILVVIVNDVENFGKVSSICFFTLNGYYSEMMLERGKTVNVF